jgi:FtsZ-interacting cell division protein ZipA
LSISIQTLKRISEDMNGLVLTDEELEIILPAIQAYMDDMKAMQHVDFQDIMAGLVFHADPRR